MATYVCAGKVETTSSTYKYKMQVQESDSSPATQQQSPEQLPEETNEKMLQETAAGATPSLEDQDEMQGMANWTYHELYQIVFYDWILL